MSKQSRISETAAHADQVETAAGTASGYDVSIEGHAPASVPAVVEPARSLSQQARADLIAISAGQFAGMTFEVSKPVTLPVLKQRSGETVAFQINAAIAYEEKNEEQKKADGGSDAPVPVLTITELRTGEQHKYVGNAIFVRELERQYPQDKESGEWGYVGRFFAVKKLEAREGKRYKDLQVVELIPTESGVKAEPRVDSAARA